MRRFITSLVVFQKKPTSRAGIYSSAIHLGVLIFRGSFNNILLHYF